MRVHIVKEWMAFIVIYFCNLLPIKKNKIMMFSYYGSNYGCNPKYITDYINEHAAEQFDIVWAFHEPDSKQDMKHIRKVKMMSLKYFYELCTSKVVITNYRTTKFFVKRKKQYYIQTWHSSLRLKQIEEDAGDVLPRHYVKMAKQDSLKCDLLLSGSRFSTDIFKQSFWYDGEIFEYGTPRNDFLMQRNKKERKRILEKLNVTEEKKIILYAPTFRKGDSSSVYNLDYSQIKEMLEKKYGDEWIVLTKLHPHMIGSSSTLIPREVQDVTAYDDIQELLYVADFLITDYSSLMFDFALTKRPCLLYVPDFTKYVNGERQLYFDINELPFMHARTNEELLVAIDNYSEKSYEQDVAKFLQEVNSYEQGQACEHLLRKMETVCYRNKRSGYHEAI